MHSAVSQVGAGRGPPRESGTHPRMENNGPAVRAGRRAEGPAQAPDSLLASPGGSDETPSAFYFHKVVFLGVGHTHVVVQQRNASHHRRQPENNVLLASAFWFIDM